MCKKLLFTLKKKKKKNYCSYALVHCSCPMNSASNTSLKKKKKAENTQNVKRECGSKPSLDMRY